MKGEAPIIGLVILAVLVFFLSGMASVYLGHPQKEAFEIEQDLDAYRQGYSQIGETMYECLPQAEPSQSWPFYTKYDHYVECNYDRCIYSLNYVGFDKYPSTGACPASDVSEKYGHHFGVLILDKGENYTYNIGENTAWIVKRTQNYELISGTVDKPPPKVKPAPDNPPIIPDPVCPAVITTACNPDTNEIKEFSTSCDVPNTWTLDLSQCSETGVTITQKIKSFFTSIIDKLKSFIYKPF